MWKKVWTAPTIHGCGKSDIRCRVWYTHPTDCVCLRRVQHSAVSEVRARDRTGASANLMANRLSILRRSSHQTARRALHRPSARRPSVRRVAWRAHKDEGPRSTPRLTRSPQSLIGRGRDAAPSCAVWRLKVSTRNARRTPSSDSDRELSRATIHGCGEHCVAACEPTSRSARTRSAASANLMASPKKRGLRARWTALSQTGRS